MPIRIWEREEEAAMGKESWGTRVIRVGSCVHDLVRHLCGWRGAAGNE